MARSWRNFFRRNKDDRDDEHSATRHAARRDRRGDPQNSRRQRKEAESP